VGRPEALRRWPWLAELDWAGLDAAFPVRIPRAYVEGATAQDDPRLLTVLPDAREALPAAASRTAVRPATPPTSGSAPTGASKLQSHAWTEAHAA
jgi:hypothetical protein